MGASERDEFLRTAWRVVVAGATHSERLLFVDEMAPTPPFFLCRLGRDEESGRFLRGCPAQLGRERYSLLASMGVGGMGLCLVVEGATTREVFEAYLE